ncbi:DUF5958 family protein [Streptomyces sp. NPDC059496]|uniref:DUF5958 family protein n=1 Tax=Streptomyces sp. NPDC059496 TaxID=3346851 RepID=UPI0036C9179E
MGRHCVQARAVVDDAPVALRSAGLRPTHTTPAALVSRGRIDEQLGKTAGLAPLDERRKAFRLLIEVLTIADARRREHFCWGGCNHWWHRLSTAA